LFLMGYDEIKYKAISDLERSGAFFVDDMNGIFCNNSSNSLLGYFTGSSMIEINYASFDNESLSRALDFSDYVAENTPYLELIEIGKEERFWDLEKEVGLVNELLDRFKGGKK